MIRIFQDLNESFATDGFQFNKLDNCVLISIRFFTMKLNLRIHLRFMLLFFSVFLKHFEGADMNHVII